MDDKLDGWKEIAAYLGKSPKTAQRWEETRGLPVHRPPGESGASVYAFREEIDAWQRGRLAAEEEAAVERAGSARWFSAGVVVLLIGILSWTLARRPAGGPAAVAAAEGNTVLRALDAGGGVLWQKVFAAPFGLLFEGRKPWVMSDVDGDGRNEVMFAYQQESGDAGAMERRLVCYDDDGTELWSYQPGREIELDGRRYLNTYAIGAVDAGRDAGAAFVALAAYQQPYHPNQISVLDGEGHLIGEYWNAGYVFELTTVDVDGDGGEEVAFVGVNNDLGWRPILGVIEAHTPGGISPGPSAFPATLRAGQELLYIAFPHTALTQATGVGSWAVALRVNDDGWMNVEIKLASDPAVFERVYLLDPHFEVRDMAFPPSFRAKLAELRGAGTIDVLIQAEAERAMRVERLVDRLR